MAEMCMDFYNPGNENSYTDGSVEGYLYKVASGELELDERHLEEAHKWPVLYHMSSLRENIINWYPFAEGASLLEIGSGCGALTGILCELAKNVVSVELTAARARINYERNKDRNNLVIYPGNLNDMRFEEKFDYVILNGVLEYANAFTGTENPYVDFLVKVKGFLAPGGRVLLSIENRIGAKYFSGAREDHCGTFFSGLEGYSDDSLVRTFSKHELADILEAAGFKHQKFYYPYPDYKFPEVIFTDSAHGLIPLKYGNSALDADRAVLFNEINLISSVKNAKETGLFANSFFVEASDSELAWEKEVIFAKCSTNRDRRFRVITRLVQDPNGNMEAEKLPAGKGAEKHIAEMADIFMASQAMSPIPFLGGKYEGSRYIYPFLRGASYTLHLNELLRSDNWGGFIGQLSSIRERLNQNAHPSEAYHTGEFSRYFGESGLTGELACSSFTNLDFTFDNLILDGGDFYVIDYEWILNGIDIPVLFVFWYAVHDFYYNSELLRQKIMYDSFMTIWGMDKPVYECFYQWRIHFINHYVKVKSVDFYKKLNIPVDISEYMQSASAHSVRSKLYLDIGDGYSEEFKLEHTVVPCCQKYHVHFILPGATGGYKKIRFDPCDFYPCKIVMLSYKLDSPFYRLNVNTGEPLNNIYDFPNEHPMFELTGSIAEAREAVFDFLIFPEENNSGNSYEKFLNNELKRVYDNSSQLHETFRYYLLEHKTVKEQYGDILVLYYETAEKLRESERSRGNLLDSYNELNANFIYSDTRYKKTLSYKLREFFSRIMSRPVKK